MTKIEIKFNWASVASQGLWGGGGGLWCNMVLLLRIYCGLNEARQTDNIHKINENTNKQTNNNKQCTKKRKKQAIKEKCTQRIDNNTLLKRIECRFRKI